MSGPGHGTTADAGAHAARAAEEVVALADTLVADFDVAELLGRLVAGCVGLLDVAAAGVLLTRSNGTDGLTAGSDDASRRVEQAQLENASGPGLDVLRTGEPATHTDPEALEGRWPSFAVALVGAGFAAVHAIPMRLRDDTIGALTLYTRSAEQLTDHDRRIAAALADAATLGIVHRRRTDNLSTLAEQLQRALNTRITIERAIGVVAEYGDIEMGVAFDAIRSYARRSRTKISDVAQALTTRGLRPAAVIDAGERA
jgi:GAF domain-containing protein